MMILCHRVMATWTSLSSVERNGAPKAKSVFALMLCESRS